MNLRKLYLKAVVYPGIVSVVGFTAYSIFDNINKDEWLPAEYSIVLLALFAIAYSLIVCALSTTLFLNNKINVRKNVIISVLSWLLLPIVFIAIMSIKLIISELEIDGKLGDMFYMVLILNIPYVFGLIYTFIKFRRSMLLVNKQA